MTNLSQIETFVEVAERSSFAEAGRSLSIPSSTVTARIKALEDRLGVRLLQRTTRNVALTPEGETYYQRCREGLRLLIDAEEDAASSLEPKGLVRVSIPTAYPLEDFTREIGKFIEEYPKVHFEIDVSDTPIDFVRDGFDLALRGRSVGSDGLIARKLANSPIAFFATAQFWIQYGLRGAARIEDVNFPVVGHSGTLKRLTGRQHVNGPIQTENYELARYIALSGASAALLPVPFCKKQVDAGQLLQMDLANADLSLPLFLVFPNRRHIPSRVRTFADHIIKNAAKPALSDGS